MSSTGNFWKNYGSVEYWDERYKQETQPFEWYQEYKDIAHVLHHALWPIATGNGTGTGTGTASATGMEKPMPLPERRSREEGFRGYGYGHGHGHGHGLGGSGYGGGNVVNPATHSNANGERADASTAKSTATVTATATKDTVPFPPKDKCRVLIVGCGSSRLGEDMMKDGWAWSGKNDDDGNGDGDEPQTAKQGGPGLGPGTGPSSGDNAHVNGKGNGKASARKSSKTATATTATKGKAMAKTTAGSTTVRRKGSESGKVQPPQGRGQGHRHPQVQVQQPHHRVHPSGGIVHVDFSPVVIAQRKERMHQMHDAFYRCIAQRKSRWMRGLPLSSLSLLPMMPKNDANANANSNHHRARASTLQDIPEAREDEQDQEKEKDRNGSDSNGNGNGGGHGNDKGDGNCNRNRHSPTTTATGHSKTKRIDPNLSVPNTTVTTDAKQVNTGGIGTSNGTTNMSFIPPMTFECVDVTQQLPYPDDSFDLIVNKGTLDAILCSNGAISNANAMMEECARVLNPRHGKMVVVSYGSPENRRVYFENHKVGRSGSGDASASASGNGNALLGGSAKESSKNEIHTEKEKGPSETIEEGNGNEDEGEGEKVEKGEEEVAEDDDEKEWWGRGLQIFKVPKPKIDNVEFQNGGNPNKCHYVYVASK